MFSKSIKVDRLKQFRIFVLNSLYSLIHVPFIIYLKIVFIFYRLRGIKIILYNLSNDYFFDMFNPIYQKLKKNAKVRVFFSYPASIKFYSFDKQKTKKYLIKNKVSRRYLVPLWVISYFAPDMFISSEKDFDGIPRSFTKVKKVQIYHGIGIYDYKEVCKNLCSYDIHFAIGPQYQFAINDACKSRDNLFKIYNVGFPKSDELVRQRCIKRKNKKFTILYLPHWNKGGSLHRFGEEIIKTLASLDVLVVVKIHNHFYSQYPGMNWRDKLKKLSNKFPNVIFSDSSNTQKLYPFADVVVTDTGSTAGFESSLIFKPLVLFYDEEWFKDHNYFGVQKDICNTSIKFQELKNLRSILFKIINNNEVMQKNIKKQRKMQKALVDNYLYNVGCATEKAVEVILKEL